jgi:DNA-binding transcriptional LysR family regulator
MTTITDLEIFARVARTGNMSAAGREMGLSPAVVSKRISLLEERLNARLFQRTTRQLTLTETGEGYFKRVVDIIALFEEAEDFVCRRNTSPRGLLKVAAPTSFARLHIAPHLPDFVVRYPDLKLDFQLTDNFVDIVREGFDVAIRIGELPDSSLVARKIAPDDRVLCASPVYLRDNPPLQRLPDLERHNCLLSGSQDSWRLKDKDGQEYQIRVDGNIRSNSSEFIREALLKGLGVGLRSTWDIVPQLESGELEIVLPEYTGSSKLAVHAVYPCREFLPAKVHAFIEFLTDLYGPEPYWNRAARPPTGDTGSSHDSKKKPRGKMPVRKRETARKAAVERRTGSNLTSRPA